jgi:class 3 adenylate cyclase
MPPSSDGPIKATSPAEIYSQLCDRILSGKAATFQALKDAVPALPDPSVRTAVLKRAFDLQRQLTWGFFRNVTRDEYPELWKLIIVPDREYAFAGDLKRVIASDDLYLGMLDIHGYTRFCQRNRHNMTMLDSLDKMIFEDVPRIAARFGVVSKRAHGDEILLVGASVTDVLETTLQVMNYLSKDLRGKVEAGPDKIGDHGFLPDFQISAGITGGQNYAALVVTRDGDLSGDLVNTAARLQARANKISPDRNKVFLSGHAHQKLKDKVAGGKVKFAVPIDFFNAGVVEFKGTTLAVFDVIFLDREAHRAAYLPLIEELYRSLKRQLWKSKVFEDSVALALTLVAKWPEAKFDRRAVIKRIEGAASAFAEEKFEKAVAEWQAVAAELSTQAGGDPLVLEYLVRIGEGYRTLVDSFGAAIDKELEERREALFSPKEIQTLELMDKYQTVYDATLADARNRVRSRKATWFRIAEEAAEALAVRIQSPK